MKAIYRGITCGKLKKGSINNVKIAGDKNITIATRGEGFKYTFTYATFERMSQDWEFIGA